MSLKRILITTLFFNLNSCFVQEFKIILDPARDSRDVGRVIGESFERGINLQWVRSIMEYASGNFPSLQLLTPPISGNQNDPLFIMQLVNRLEPNLYLSFHSYQESGTTPTITIYYLVKNPLSDRQNRPDNNLKFIPYQEAHRQWHHLSKKYAQILYDTLIKEGMEKHTVCRGPFGVPFRSLVGINAPAVAIEIGIQNETMWRYYTEVIAKALWNIAQHSVY